MQACEIGLAPAFRAPSCALLCPPESPKEKQMQVKRGALSVSRFAAVCLLVCAAGKAHAFEIPPFKGNDTGGIIAWTLAQQADARKLATDHCASYGKLVKRLATQPYYGGYISFACVWPRSERIVRVLY
jgi:hypothetical protein